MPPNKQRIILTDLVNSNCFVNFIPPYSTKIQPFSQNLCHQYKSVKSVILMLIIKITLILILLAFNGYSLYILIKGAPFAVTKPKTLTRIIKLANPKTGDTVLDLGSGDGRIVKKFAKLGHQTTGIELNPLLVWWSQRNLPSNADIIKGDFWTQDLSKYDIIIVFGLFSFMKRLSKKLQAEAKPGTKIICNTYKLPGLEPVKIEDRLYLYII